MENKSPTSCASIPAHEGSIFGGHGHINQAKLPSSHSICEVSPLPCGLLVAGGKAECCFPKSSSLSNASSWPKRLTGCQALGQPPARVPTAATQEGHRSGGGRQLPATTLANCHSGEASVWLWESRTLASCHPQRAGGNPRDSKNFVLSLFDGDGGVLKWCSGCLGSLLFLL